MNAFRHALSDNLVLWLTFGSFSLIIAYASLTLFFYHYLPLYIPLYNQMPWGSPRIAQRIQIFLPLAITGGIFFFNFITTTVFYQKAPIIIRMICFTSAAVAFLALLLLLRTFMLVLL